MGLTGAQNARRPFKASVIGGPCHASPEWARSSSAAMRASSEVFLGIVFKLAPHPYRRRLAIRWDAANLRQVEQQYLRVLLRPGDLQRSLLRDGRAVSGTEFLAVQLHATARYLQPGVPLRSKRILHALVRLQHRSVKRSIGMDLQRTSIAVLAGIRFRYLQQLPAALGGAELLLLILRLDAFTIRHQPYLQKMNFLCLRVVVLAVTHTASRAHVLHLSRADHAHVPHTVLMFEGAFQHVG